MKELKEPNEALIDAYIKKYEESESYLADVAIANLFKKFPQNDKVEDILLKISVINDLYSTNIFAKFKMANHIQKLQIDSYLSNSDPSLVNMIATGHGILKPKNDGDRNFYSFATKYCNWHNQSEYPIYDSFVHKILMAYKRKDESYNFRQVDLRNFPKFKEIVMNFKVHYDLEKYGVKEIDKFLWLYGKEMFPHN